MPDVEKVEKVINGLEDSLANNGCGFMDGVGELFAVSGEDLQNAIALLKAQEPIAPIRHSAHAQGADEVWYECGKCGEFLGVNRHSKQFCAKCGRAVKWE